MFDQILNRAPLYLLVAIRCFALVMSLPLFSTRTVPRISKIAFCGYLAYLVLPHVNLSSYGSTILSYNVSFEFVMLAIGEALIGLITGFSVTLIFAAFSSAGQFFAFQMGFSASEVYDALSQVENPLMGQYFNLIAMLIFLQNKWALQLFSTGLVNSFKVLNAFSLIQGREIAVKYLLSGLSGLFYNAFIISLPIIGSLLLVSVTMGLLAKASPNMNLMSDMFPVTLMFSFFLITALLPYFCEFFEHAFATAFQKLFTLGFALDGRMNYGSGGM